MARDFDVFATRLTAPLTGLARLLTDDREVAAALVRSALTRAYSDRVPDERRTIAALVHAWLAGAPPAGEPAELPYDLELLRRSLDALPEKQRVAVVLHHWSGLPVAEIAAMLRRTERVVEADLAAGVAELHLPADPDEPPPTVEARLAALVAAAGPPHVDLAQVVEAGRRQRRHRRRTAVAAAGVLVAAGTVAALLTGGEPPARPKPVLISTRAPSPEVVPSVPVIDDRARRLTAQLTAAMVDVLPGVTDLRPGDGQRPPLEFATGPPHTYFAEARLGTTLLFFQVESRAWDAFVPCSEPGLDCTYRQFPDETIAEVAAVPGSTSALSLTSRRPDSTAIYVTANSTGAPELTVEDMFRFATVLTY